MGSALLGPAITAGVFAYGFAQWDYGSESFHFTDEGWFGRDSEFGGADKVGHVVAAHFFTTGISRAHRWMGFDCREAAKRGALTAFGVLTAMEIGDGFSGDHGFSWQDTVCDAVGCAFGYVHETSPWFARAFDLRWEYWPSSGAFDEDNTDPVTAYEDSAFLLAFNTGALLEERHTVLDFVDLQLGYQVRDLDRGPTERRQEVFLGAGLNLANVLRRVSGRRIGGIFDYYQVPGISLRVYFDFND
ncbi:MAG: DUF2279 domain-containing protein [Planctomycetota bacterium]